MAISEAKKYEAEFDELQARFDNLKDHAGRQSEVIGGLIGICSQLAATHPDEDLVKKLDEKGDWLMGELK